MAEERKIRNLPEQLVGRCRGVSSWKERAIGGGGPSASASHTQEADTVVCLVAKVDG